MRRLLMITLFMLATGTRPASAGIQIIVEPQGHPPLAGPPSPVFFEDERVVVQVRVCYVAQLNARKADPNARFRFATRDWTKSVALAVRGRVSGAVMAVEQTVLRSGLARTIRAEGERDSGDRFELRDGEVVSANIALAGLPPGDYVIETTSEGASESGRASFVIRRGDEDPATVRLFYRYRADKARTFAERVSILRELFDKYEPNNDFLLEQMADESVDKVSFAQTILAYGQAKAVREANLRAYRATHAKVPEAILRQAEKDLERLTIFERVLPYYRSNARQLRFAPIFVGSEKRYAWYDRASGRLVSPINPANPEERSLAARQPQ